MSPPTDNVREIASAAAGLSDDKLLKVVRLLEMGKSRPELTSALDLLRPRLAELRPPRRPTIQRLLFLPVEELLEDVARYRRGRGRISREILAPVWDLFRAHADDGVIARAEVAAAAADSARMDTLNRAGGLLWKHAAQVLGDLVGKGGASSAHWPKSFQRNDDIAAQLAALVEALRAAHEIQDLKVKIPGRPVEALSEYDRELLQDAFTRIGQVEPENLRPLVLAFCARVRRPGEVLGILSRCGAASERAAYEKLSNEVGTSIIDRYVDAAADGGRSMASAPMRDLVRFAERVTDGVTSVAELMGDALDPKARGRMQGAFQNLRTMLLGGVVNDADEKLVTLLRDASQAEGGKGRAAGFALAEDAALTFRRCLALAPKVGFSQEARHKARAVVDGVERHAERLISEVRSGRATAANPGEDLEYDVITALRVVELAAGPEDAEAILSRLRTRFGEF